MPGPPWHWSGAGPSVQQVVPSAAEELVAGDSPRITSFPARPARSFFRPLPTDQIRERGADHGLEGAEPVAVGGHGRCRIYPRRRWGSVHDPVGVEAAAAHHLVVMSASHEQIVRLA